MGIFQTAVRNMSYVHSEIESLFKLMGLKFLSASRHKIYQAIIGKGIMDLTKGVLEQNILCAKEFEKSEAGYHQEPIERELGWSEQQISKMTTKDANAVLSTLGFPLSGTIAEKKRNVTLLNQTAHENKRQCMELYGHTNFVRQSAAADCSWLTRTFGKNAKSNCGQVTLMHQGTGLPIAHATRIITCATCQKAKTKGTQIPDHDCQVNHAGKSIKSMEPEMICELTLFLRQKHNLVTAQMCMDGDATPINHLQLKLLHDPAFRWLGEKAIVCMKSDDNHRNKTTKNHIYTTNTELTEVVGKKKVPPLDVKRDAPHLARITNLIRIQHISWQFVSSDKRQESFCETMNNIAAHYFNDDPGVHASCERICPKNCCVVKARQHNSLVAVMDVFKGMRSWRENFSPLQDCMKQQFLFRIANVLKGFLFFFGATSHPRSAGVVESGGV